MSVWVLHQTLTPEEESKIRERDYIVLPLDNLPDLTEVSSQSEFRVMLQKLYPELPPESLQRIIHKNWKLYHDLHPEDVVAVPLKSKPEVMIAEITGDYQYRVDHKGRDVHTVPVKWHEKTISRRGLIKYKALFDEQGDRMFEVDNKEARTVIREKLPHAYNRFVPLKWLIILFLLWNAYRYMMQTFH